MRRLLTILLLVASPLVADGPIPQPTRADWLVFASSDCEECQWLKNECLPALQLRLKTPLPRALLFDLDADANYETLVAVEDALKTTGEGVPILLAGRRLLYGKETIAAWASALRVADLATELDPKILPELTKGTPSLYAGGDTEEKPAPPSPPQAPTEPNPESARILYFRTPGCPSCALTGKRLDYLANQFPDVPVRRITVDSAAAKYLQYAVAKRLGLVPGKRLVTPMVVSGTTAIHGKAIGNASLTTLLDEAPATPFWQEWDEAAATSGAKAELNTLTKRLTLPAILVGGLIDGINPCAFAVITFLVSYLSLSRGGGRRTALIFGLLFTLGVFLCYFLIGIGLSELIEVVQGHRGIIRAVYGTTGGLCLVFGVLAVWDTCRARQGEAMRFGMPKSLHHAAHALIRRQVGRGALGLGTVLLGMMVSALELVCTGQIYLPALVLMNESGRNARSLALLVAYNLAFVAPLILVVILGAYGIGSKQLAGWGRRHAALTRALTAVLFLALAALLLALAWRG